MSFERSAALFCAFLTLGPSSRAQQAGVDIRDAALGVPIHRDAWQGDPITYRVVLPRDGYVEARLEQWNGDVTLTIATPDGKEFEKTAAGSRQHETKILTLITPVAGEYRIQLRSEHPDLEGVTYDLRIDEPRTPTVDERDLEQARILTAEGREQIRAGKYDAALAPIERALAIRERILGPDHLLVADSLHALAVFYDNKGDYQRAAPVNLRALGIRERALGPDHQDVASTLYNLAWIYLVRQDYAQSEATYQRVLAIQERTFGQNSRELTSTLNDLAILYHKQGDYDRAVEVDERVLAVREKIFGPDDAGVARTLGNLGLDYIKQGEFAKAEPRLLRAADIYGKTLGADHPDNATVLNNLGMVYADKGDYASAERFHRRALDIDERALGPDHPNVASELSNLAWLYQHLRDYSRAEPLFARALAIREKAFGPNHSDVAEALNNLAMLYIESKTGTDASIESMLERALAIFEKTLGPDHEKVSAPLTGLARISANRKDYARAERQYQQALGIREKTLGPDHPNVAAVLASLAKLYRAKGDPRRAAAFWTRYSDIVERNLERNLPIGSERQKLDYLRLFADDLNNILSLEAQTSEGSEAVELAFTSVLRRKGRALDATTDDIGVLRSHADERSRPLFTELTEWRSRLATVTLRGPDGAEPAAYRARIQDAEDHVDRLESAISIQSAAFRAQSRPITLEAVRRALPSGTSLIEFVRYQPTTADGLPRGGPRYIAYVLFDRGDPRRVELGDAVAIERDVDAWRRALGDPARTDVDRLARALDERIMRPIRRHLRASSHLLISADGVLNLVPFAAFVDERGAYLIERYAITYLTSGRDLLRLQDEVAARSADVVLADPAFGDPATLTVERTQGRASAGTAVDYSQIFFGPLPGVIAEVRALRTLLPEATFLTQASATKNRLMAVAGPRILHIATHGFFLEDPGTGEPQSGRPGGDRETRLAKAMGRVENPLLRSGLALAGANAGATAAGAGVLTALEAADLDLWGTKLVVLSACDTGIGAVRNGDGVYGLRRALVLAGSESQMITLWPVSDRRTRDLIVSFYSALLTGEGRGEALRHAQQEMLGAGVRVHPYYWAGFILSGQWTRLETP